MRCLIAALFVVVFAGCTDAPPGVAELPQPALDLVVMDWSYEGATSTRVCEAETPVSQCESVKPGVENRRRIDVDGQPLRLTGELVMEGALASTQDVLIFMQVRIDGIWHVASESTIGSGVGQIAVDWDLSSMEGPLRVAVSNRDYAPEPVYAYASVAQPFTFTGQLTYQP